MISHATLPKPFWGEAVKTVIDLINLSPLVHLDCNIPHRVWIVTFLMISLSPLVLLSM
jgi:hypothetical protein